MRKPPSPGGWLRCARFFKFAQREGLAETNPAKPLRNPRPDRKLPHFLSTDEIGKLLDAPPATQAAGPARSGDPGNDVLRRPARERAASA